MRKESSNKETRRAIFKCCRYIISFRLRLGVHNGIIIREWNGMYLSKGNEWKKIELNEINLNWMF